MFLVDMGGNSITNLLHLHVAYGTCALPPFMLHWSVLLPLLTPLVVNGCGKEQRIIGFMIKSTGAGIYAGGAGSMLSDSLTNLEFKKNGAPDEITIKTLFCKKQTMLFLASESFLVRLVCDCMQPAGWRHSTELEEIVYDHSSRRERGEDQNFPS